MRKSDFKRRCPITGVLWLKNQQYGFLAAALIQTSSKFSQSSYHTKGIAEARVVKCNIQH